MLFEILLEPSRSFEQNLITFVIVAAALIFSLVMHELGHGYVALWNGDKTAQINGRLSLNPVRHLDPIGFLMLAVMGFGYAKPVPVNPSNFKNQRRGMFFVSIAGVSVNIILAFIGSFFLVLTEKLLVTGAIDTNMLTVIIYQFFLNLVYFNLMLCFFNIIPLFPLDGSRLLESVTRRNNRFMVFLRKYSFYILIGLIGLGIIVDRFELPYSWWRYVDILGTYLSTFSGWVFDGFRFIWRFVFGF